MNDDLDLKNVSRALSSDTRLNILKILVNNDLSSIEVYNKYVEKFDGKKHRETIYRALETLLSAGILEKKYSNERKNVVYSIKYNQFIIELINQKVKTKNILR
ncbi:MAG: transcriptional repressor [bacterium]|nr:transcriptional repressor [bacterium]